VKGPLGLDFAVATLNYWVHKGIAFICEIRETDKGHERILETINTVGHDEAKLFLGAFSSYDRHRDMQMDIDNMSYEAQNICNLVFDKSSKICLGGKLQQICAMFYSDFGVFCLTEAKRNHQAVLFLLALDVRAMNKHVDIEPNDAREVWSTHEPVHINPSDPSRYQQNGTPAKERSQCTVQGKYDSIIVEVKSYYMSMSRYRDDKKRKGEIMKVYANDQIKTCVEFPECFV
ncbi:hypothetical protein ACJX0J_015194, partial [Zea mays]